MLPCGKRRCPVKREIRRRGADNSRGWCQPDPSLARQAGGGSSCHVAVRARSTREGVYAAGSHTFAYTLNCDSVHEIAPGQAVTYAMQIQLLPAPGTAKIGWSVPAGSPFTAGVITLR